MSASRRQSLTLALLTLSLFLACDQPLPKLAADRWHLTCYLESGEVAIDVVAAEVNLGSGTTAWKSPLDSDWSGKTNLRCKVERIGR